MTEKLTEDTLKKKWEEMPLKEIYWNMKQETEYLVGEGKGYGDKVAITEGQVQKLIKQLEKKFRVLVTLEWIPHLYGGVNYSVLTKGTKKTSTLEGSILESGEQIGNPYVESGDIIIRLEKVDTDDKLEFSDTYSAAGNNLTFLKAVRKTYHTRVSLLKWLGVATEEEDPEIKNLRDKAEQDKKDLANKERKMLKTEWIDLYTRPELSEIENKRLEVLKKFSKAKNEIEIEKYINDESQSALNVTIRKVKEVK